VGIHIEKVDLPGIGIRHDLVTEGGRRISVVSHRDGERDLGLFEVDDPDACRYSMRPRACTPSRSPCRPTRPT
jgi:TrkA domain protein